MNDLETSWWWPPERDRRVDSVDEICELAADACPTLPTWEVTEKDRDAGPSLQGFSDAELLSRLLSGTREAGALARASALLSRVGGLPALVEIDSRAFRFLSLSKQESLRLAAAVEIGRRLARCQVPERAPMSRPAEVARYLALRYGCVAQEVAGALFLDSRLRLIAVRELFRGSSIRCQVEPRAILREALLLRAEALTLFHTHPSGDPDPSAEDHAFTRKAHEAGEALGIRVVDHVVLGSPGRWVSLYERRPW
jgi:DNA repair protein RadC